MTDRGSEPPTERIAIILPSPPDPLFDELGQMLADGLAAHGTEVAMLRDQDVTRLDHDLVILLGECLRMKRSTAVLKKGTAKTVFYWGMEPLGHPTHFADVYAKSEDSRKDRFVWRLEQRVNDCLRPIIPPQIRPKLTLVARKLLVGRQPSASDRQTVSKKYWWYKRMERLEWIERGYSEGWLYKVFVSAPERVDILAARKIPSTFLPLGYHPAMSPIEEHERDLDVVFLGPKKDDRSEKLRVLARDLAAEGFTLQINEGPLYGAARSSFLARAKVTVILPGIEEETPRIRFLLGLAAGTLIVSEPLGDSQPFVPGEHFVMTPIEEMHRVIAHYLRRASEREAIVSRGRTLITQHLTMQQAATHLLGASRGDSSISL